MNNDWTQWIGLPHEVGADPRNGKAACCLVICHLLLSNKGYRVPDLDPLLKLAHQKNWALLQLAFDKHSYAIDSPQNDAITLLRNGPSGLGLGIIVNDSKLLFPHHKRGVVAAPIDQLRLMQFRKLYR